MSNVPPYDPKAATRTHGARIRETSIDDVLAAMGSTAVQRPAPRRKGRRR